MHLFLADDFDSAASLGMYLKNLAKDEPRYIDMLWKKAHFIYHQRGFHDAYCQLCYKLHYLDQFRKSYDDLYAWLYQGSKSCRLPDDNSFSNFP